MFRTTQASFSRNRLLSIMAAGDFDRLRPDLDRVALDAKDVLEEAGQSIEHVYFLEPGVASVVASTGLGATIEVGLFGPEGMSGTALVHGTTQSPFRTFIQVPGAGLKIKADIVRAAVAESTTLRDLMLRYAQSFAIQVAYTALANGRYTIAERLSRWLLMCHDRIDGNELQLTHEFLAVMLGVRRAGITTALQILEGDRIIRALRGRIEILDRGRLEATAGDCYGRPEKEYERLIGGYRAP